MMNGGRHRFLLGNKVTAITVAGLHEAIAAAVAADRKMLILNTNAHGINLAQRLPWLKDFRNHADIVHADGYGVVLGARILGFHIPQRITYADWLPELSRFAAERGLTLYFLGARPGVADEAADRLRSRAPGLRVVGTHHGYFAKEGPENDAVVDEINRLRPDILVVGFGMPLQERWIRDNSAHLQVRVFLVGGGCFDVVARNIPRAPLWMRDHGLEWLFLSIVAPRRFLLRYLVGIPVFFGRVMAARLRNRRLAEPGPDTESGA